MSWSAFTHTSTSPDSATAVATCVRAVRDAAAEAGGLRGAIVYFSLAHDPEEIAETLSEGLPGVPVLGGSVQGLVSRDVVEEGSYFVGVLGWAGDIDVSVVSVEDIDVDTYEKGRTLGEAVLAVERRKLSVLLYDPLTTANVRDLLRGFDEASGRHPLIGAAAAGPWGPMRETVQLCGDQVLAHAAVVMTVGGDFEVVTDASTGTEPTLHDLVVTRAEGNEIFEFDGRPALEVWTECIGIPSDQISTEEFASWALGIERGGPGEETWTVLSTFRYDVARGSISLQTDVPQGSRVVLHLRSPEVILERMGAMAESLVSRIAHRPVGAVLSFECGGRTSPFLGVDGTRQEHEQIQGALPAGAPWLGLMAWGEVVPTRCANEFYNYTYPIAVLCR
jgi:hypothetical protein